MKGRISTSLNSFNSLQVESKVLCILKNSQAQSSSFNSLQVESKDNTTSFAYPIGQTCFNSLQVESKEKLRLEFGVEEEGFQFLIGRVKRDRWSLNRKGRLQVSIPYRQSQKKKKEVKSDLKIKRFNSLQVESKVKINSFIKIFRLRVSIPYRQSQKIFNLIK